jgi:hypothetical protein
MAMKFLSQEIDEVGCVFKAATGGLREISGIFKFVSPRIATAAVASHKSTCHFKTP